MHPREIKAPIYTRPVTVHSSFIDNILKLGILSVPGTGNPLRRQGNRGTITHSSLAMAPLLALTWLEPPSPLPTWPCPDPITPSQLYLDTIILSCLEIRGKRRVKVSIYYLIGRVERLAPWNSHLRGFPPQTDKSSTWTKNLPPEKQEKCCLEEMKQVFLHHPHPTYHPVGFPPQPLHKPK